MTDREVLFGILTAVLELGEKLTGQEMVVRIQT